MRSSIAPSALSHVDCTPGAGAEDCITSARRLWRAELVGRAGFDRWSGKCAAGGMSGDHDRYFSILVLGAFSTGVFNINALLPRINIGADVWGESSIMTGVY